MLKTLLRVLSIFFLIGGIFMINTAGEIKEDNKPNEIHYGVTINGQYIETDSGYIGGNPEVEEEMDSLAGIGWMITIFGAGLLISSFVISKKEKNDTYDY